MIGIISVQYLNLVIFVGGGGLKHLAQRSYQKKMLVHIIKIPSIHPL